MVLLSTAITAAVLSTAVYEEFNSLDELKQNWWISSWGHSKKQYDPNNVAVEDGVLKLTMVPDSADGAPRPLCGEVTYTSRKVLYGSYRASIKTTAKSGGVVGWFVYQDGVPGDGNLHEVDMEILTEDLTQIQYTLHHDAYGVDHKIDPLSFNPSEDFHEYRFDWYPDSVVYYIDGERREKLTVKVPDDSCSIMLNYWSNNDPYWGGSMPDTTTHMWIDYMHYIPLEDMGTTAIKQSPAAQHKAPFVSTQGKMVTITPPSAGAYTFSIYSLSGKRIHKEKMSGVSTLEMTPGAGTFIFELENGSNSMTQKVILK